MLLERTTIMERIYLHPTTEKDFEDYYRVRCDPTDVYWNGFTSKPEYESFKVGFMKRTGYARFSEPEDRRNYLIKTIGDDITLGFVQLIMRADCVYLGYSILQLFQGNGYATEALRLGIKLACSYSNQICLNIRDDNIASQRVAQKCGFVPTEKYIEREYPTAGIVRLRKYILVG